MPDLINSKVWFTKPKLVCGVMTGTSLDSIDIAFVKFSIGKHGEHEFQFIGGKEYKLPKNYQKHVLKLISKKNTVSDYSQFQVAFSHIIADAVKSAINDFELNKDIDIVAVHGQTIWHEPKKSNVFDYEVSHTYQSCSGTTLSSLLDIPVVYDFRSSDVASGGNGAPLLPIFDYNFLKNSEKDIIALNIGGIANITYIPKGVSDEQIKAFDTGPGNMLLDIAMMKLYKKKFDKNGKISQSGKVNSLLLDYLLDDEYFRISPPKSTGREKFGDDYFNKCLKFKVDYKISDEDFISTLTQFTAETIAKAILTFTKDNSMIYVSGGGRKNSDLIFRLKLLLSNCEICNIDEIGIDGDLKEAIGFAYIGWRSVGGMYGNLPAATGANRKVRLGAIAL